MNFTTLLLNKDFVKNIKNYYIEIYSVMNIQAELLEKSRLGNHLSNTD